MEEITSEKVSREGKAEVTELTVESENTIRQVGIVEIGPKQKFYRAPEGPFVPKTTPTDGHTAERHKVLNTPPGTPPSPEKTDGQL